MAKTNESYTWRFADGEKMEIRAGEDGVTEEWIAFLHEADTKEDSLRRKESRHCFSYDELKEKGYEPGFRDDDPCDAPEGEVPPRSGGLVPEVACEAAEISATEEKVSPEERLLKALMKLPGQDRELIVRCVYKRVPKQKIAEAEGVCPSAISNRLKKIYVAISRSM